MQEVPREAFNIGLAGVLPYVATSLSTVYCAWEINHASTTGVGFLMSEKTAELSLHILEPLQIGYGAVVSSTQVSDIGWHLTLHRLSPSLVPSTGVLSGQATAATTDTGATLLVLLRLLSRGQPFCCQPSTPSSLNSWHSTSSTTLTAVHASVA